MELSLKNDMMTRPIADPTDLNEDVKTMKQEEIETFSSQIVHGHTKTVLWGNNKYVMTQSPEKGEEPCLPNGLCVANTYTEMTTGNKCCHSDKNQMAVLITIGKGGKITWMVAANRVPPVEVMPRTLREVGQNAGNSVDQDVD